MKAIGQCLNALFQAIDFINKTALLFSTVGFAGLCLLQVICRYVFNNSLTWSDQACRYLFCVTTFLGAALCVKERSHTTIDILAELVGERAKKYQAVFVHILIFAFSIILMLSGWVLMSRNMDQTTTTLPLTMGVIYMMIPVSAAIMAINALRVLVEALRQIMAKPGKGDAV